MKKVIRFSLLLFVFIPSALFAGKNEDVFKKYTAEGYYKIDNNEIVVSKVVEGLAGSREEIYNKVKAYFVRSYGDSKAVIQADDIENGLIMGKGLYTDLASFNLGAWTIKAYHILRVDVKEGRMRIICSASHMVPNSAQYIGDECQYQIVDYAPITDKRATYAYKSSQLAAFIKLVEMMNNTVYGVEQAVKNGVIKEENTDW